MDGMGLVYNWQDFMTLPSDDLPTSTSKPAFPVSLLSVAALLIVIRQNSIWDISGGIDEL